MRQFLFIKRFIHLLLIRLPKTPAAHPKLDTLVINCSKRKKRRKKGMISERASGEWEGHSLWDSDSCHCIPESIRRTQPSQSLSLCTQMPFNNTGHQRCNPKFNIERSRISLECSLNLHHDLSRLRLLTTIYGQPAPAIPFPHPS